MYISKLGGSSTKYIIYVHNDSSSLHVYGNWIIIGRSWEFQNDFIDGDHDNWEFT